MTTASRNDPKALIVRYLRGTKSNITRLFNPAYPNPIEFECAGMFFIGEVSGDLRSITIKRQVGFTGGKARNICIELDGHIDISEDSTVSGNSFAASVCYTMKVCEIDERIKPLDRDLILRNVKAVLGDMEGNGYIVHKGRQVYPSIDYWF